MLEKKKRRKAVEDDSETEEEDQESQDKEERRTRRWEPGQGSGRDAVKTESASSVVATGFGKILHVLLSQVGFVPPHL